jgi:hypothetical protein
MYSTGGKMMTLREYLAGRHESLKEFSARTRIPYARARRYYYRTGRLVDISDLNKILAETNGLVNADGMASEKRDKILYVGRGRPPKNVLKKSRVHRKGAGDAA